MLHGEGGNLRGERGLVAKGRPESRHNHYETRGKKDYQFKKGLVVNRPTSGKEGLMAWTKIRDFQLGLAQNR